MYRKDVTYGELIKKVYPDLLEYLTDDAINYYDNTYVIWEPEEENEIEPKVYSLLNHQSYIYSEMSTIFFGSYTQSIFPTPGTEYPYMSVVTMLEKEGGGILSSKSAYGHSVSNLAAASSLYNVSSGRYRTIGHHYVQSLPGYQPPFTAKNTSSSWIVK